MKKTALDFLAAKQENEIDIRKAELERDNKKLELEQQKLFLEEKKIEHQKIMDQKKLELEAIRLKMDQAEKNKLYNVIDHYQKMLGAMLMKKTD